VGPGGPVGPINPVIDPLSVLGVPVGVGSTTVLVGVLLAVGTVVEGVEVVVRDDASDVSMFPPTTAAETKDPHASTPARP
jgi:hypothetical protein